MEGIFVCICLAIISFLCFHFANTQKEKAKEKKEQSEKRVAEACMLKQKERDLRIKEYGETPILSSESIKERCFYEIYREAKKIYIQHVSSEYLINFSDIREVSLLEGDSLISSTTSSKSKTDTGNMIGRAIVGGAILGTAGEIIGASTASKTTTTRTNSSVTKRYKLVISTNSFENPTIILTQNFSSFDYLSKLYSVLKLAIEQV